MPSPRNTFYKILFFTFLILISCSLFNGSCNSANTAVKTGKDSLATFTLPDPEPLATAEAERIRNNSQAWFDSVLKIKGFASEVPTKFVLAFMPLLPVSDQL